MIPKMEIHSFWRVWTIPIQPPNLPTPSLWVVSSILQSERCMAGNWELYGFLDQKCSCTVFGTTIQIVMANNTYLIAPILLTSSSCLNKSAGEFSDGYSTRSPRRRWGNASWCSDPGAVDRSERNRKCSGAEVYCTASSGMLLEDASSQCPVWEPWNQKLHYAMAAPGSKPLTVRNWFNTWSKLLAQDTGNKQSDYRSSN